MEDIVDLASRLKDQNLKVSSLIICMTLGTLPAASQLPILSHGDNNCQSTSYGIKPHQGIVLLCVKYHGVGHTHTSKRLLTSITPDRTVITLFVLSNFLFRK